MYRQFGSRLIVNGRRVRDDYWESKARRQGFTENDPAGEKRPGVWKAGVEASKSEALAAVPHGQVIYQSTTEPLKTFPWMNPDPESKLGNFPAIPVPPQVIAQAAHSVKYNQGLQNQRQSRAEFLEDVWNRTHDPVSQQPLGGTTQQRPSNMPMGYNIVPGEMHLPGYTEGSR
jgi:hypothetical protein